MAILRQFKSIFMKKSSMIIKMIMMIKMIKSNDRPDHPDPDPEVILDHVHAAILTVVQVVLDPDLDPDHGLDRDQDHNLGRENDHDRTLQTFPSDVDLHHFQKNGGLPVLARGPFPTDVNVSATTALLPKAPTVHTPDLVDPILDRPAQDLAPVPMNAI